MFSIKVVLLLLMILFWTGCSEAPVAPKLSPHEQLSVDTVKVKGLLTQFEKQVQFEKLPLGVDKYLSALARQITREEESLRAEKVVVRVHQDTKSDLKRVFAFPGVVISLPSALLHEVNFENELAAAIALELAQIERRDLAQEMDKAEHPILFGDLSIFWFSQQARGEAIELGTKLMYAAGYDPRGMVALFQKFPHYYADTASPAGQKELKFYIKQAQKAKNDFIPSLQPIVRSNDFLLMKKELKGS